MTALEARDKAVPQAVLRPRPGAAGRKMQPARGHHGAMEMIAFRLTSPDFEDGGELPPKFTCDGEDVSPALEWEGAPDGAGAFALVVEDPDADDFVHWVVYNATASQTGGLPEAISASPDAPPQGTNDFGRIGWGGPCPPSGEHRYRFTLLALDAPLDLGGAPSTEEVRAAAEGHVLDEAVLEGTYRRRGG